MSPEEFDEFRRFESEAPRIDSGKTYSNEELHIRLLEPSEAAQISRAIYKSYGATYFYEDVYYPDRVKNFIETGRQVSAGAFISNGEMVGHCALMDIEWRAASAELGQAVVDPEFRGKGCLGRLSDFLTLEAVNMGLTGLMAQAVTTHGFSQKILYKLNFSHCGLLLAHAPEGLTFRGLQERPSEHRESKEILYKRITVQNPGVIYPPPGHDRFMKRMFSNIHAEPRVAVPSVSLPVFDRDSSEIEIESHAFIPKGYALIKIKSLGPDIVDAVRKQVGSLCRNNIKVITLYLKLSDPMTYHLGQKMEGLGFTVTGLMPGTEMGDVMVMQYFNNLRIDFESIDLYSEEARRTMDYIRRRLKM
jgi:serine/threonine-protein kinase RsbW